MPPSFCNIILERKRYNRTLCAFYSYARQLRIAEALSFECPHYAFRFDTASSFSSLFLSLSLSLSLSCFLSIYIPCPQAHLVQLVSLKYTITLYCGTTITTYTVFPVNIVYRVNQLRMIKQNFGNQQSSIYLNPSKQDDIHIAHQRIEGTS